MGSVPPETNTDKATETEQVNEILIMPGHLGKDTTLKYVEVKHEDKELKAQFIVRTPSPILSNIVFAKKALGLFQLSFSYVEIQQLILGEPKDLKKLETQVNFQDFEIACHSSIALPRDQAVKLRDKLNKLLEKTEEDE